MGMTLFIHTLEGRNMSKESDDHTLMHDHAEQLDAACKELGVLPLSSYFDTTDLELNMGEFDDEEFDAEPVLDPETGFNYGIDDMKWFDAGAGLKTLQALRGHVESQPLAGLDTESKSLLLEELDDCIGKLQGPAARGGKFNLPVIM